MTNESNDGSVDAKVALAIQVDRVTSQLDGFGLELDMDLSDVNPFDSFYTYTASRESPDSRLRITKSDISDFSGSPITTDQYGVRVASRKVDEEGLRLIEEFTIAVDRVADETQKEVDIEIPTDSPMGRAVVQITGRLEAQPDRISHRVTLGEFEEDGSFIDRENIDEPRVYKEQPSLTQPEDILSRLKEVLGEF